MRDYDRPTTPEGWKELSGRLRKSSAANYEEKEKSFERCDTDGFLSQWASGLSGQLESRLAEICDNGGLDEFRGLFDVNTGKRVPAVLIDGKYGMCWAICDEATGEFTGKFVKALDYDATPRQRANLAKKGYEERKEMVPAWARFEGRGTGLSGTCWVATYRLDGGYPGRPRRNRRSQ